MGDAKVKRLIALVLVLAIFTSLLGFKEARANSGSAWPYVGGGLLLGLGAYLIWGGTKHASVTASCGGVDALQKFTTVHGTYNGPSYQLGYIMEFNPATKHAVLIKPKNFSSTGFVTPGSAGGSEQVDASTSLTFTGDYSGLPSTVQADISSKADNNYSGLLETYDDSRLDAEAALAAWSGKKALIKRIQDPNNASLQYGVVTGITTAQHLKFTLKSTNGGSASLTIPSGKYSVTVNYECNNNLDVRGIAGKPANVFFKVNPLKVSAGALQLTSLTFIDTREYDFVNTVEIQ
jgi:hypothetical protein